MKSLKNLSDKELLHRLQKLVKKEHELNLEILPHLIEVEDRRIFRSLGYCSMFVYCTGGLGYAESSANRRICAARAIRKCLKAYDYLRDGRVNLSTLSIAWKYITPDLLDEIADKNQRQVLAIIACFEPRIKHRDNTRPVMVKRSVEVPPECLPAGALSGSSGGMGGIGGSDEPAPAAPESENSKLGQNHHRSGGKKSTTDTQSNSRGPVDE